MASIDTNVLVRLLVSDDQDQQQAALRCLAELEANGEDAFVSTVVVVELAWVLESVYDYDRASVARAIRAVTEAAPFAVEARPAVRQAIDWYERRGGQIADWLILAVAHAQGREPLHTFDRKLSRHPLCRRL